jgi:glycerol-3-phosphate acyltransferase PlsX
MTETIRTVVLDAMGGDHGPSVCVAGAVQAINEASYALKVILVGDESEIRAQLHKHRLNGNGDRLEIVHATDVVRMEDPATDGMRKKDSSISIAMRLHKEGRGNAVVSTGHTGAFMAAGLANLGRLPGVSRPAIACMFPSEQGQTLVVDVGANPVCKPQNLVEFGIMGSVYVRDVMGVESPRVGLLSIGEEPSKGNELTINSHPIFQLSRLNFIGNIEGRDILRGKADVVRRQHHAKVCRIAPGLPDQRRASTDLE